MDRPIRTFVVYKARNLDKMKKELKKLERERQDIIDASNYTLDGQPRGKGGVTNQTEAKALKLLRLRSKNRQN